MPPFHPTLCLDYSSGEGTASTFLEDSPESGRGPQVAGPSRAPAPSTVSAGA